MTDILSDYKPTPTQGKAHRLKHRYKLFGGAMGGGKTRWLCEEAKDLSLRFPGNRGVMCRWHLSDFKNSTLKTLLECLPPEIIHAHNWAEKTITLINGSEIIYMGMSEEENVSKLKSMELGWFCIDEASEVPREVFLLFQSRLRRYLPNGEFPPFYGLLASNPADNWLKDDFVLSGGGSDYAFVPSLPRDNPYLPPDYEKRLRKTYPEDWVKRFLEGSWDELAAGDNILQSDWIRMAVNREIVEEDKSVIAADIARFGDDEIVIDYGQGNRLVEQEAFGKKSLMETVGRIVYKRKKYKARLLVIDDVGMGGGVTDRLREQKEYVKAVNGGETATDERFVNLKTQMWWHARDLFQAGNVSIINDPILIRQLGVAKHEYRSNGKIVIETKEDIKKRLGRSPDRADTLILLLWGASHLRDAARDFRRTHKGDTKPLISPYGWNYYQGQEVILR